MTEAATAVLLDAARSFGLSFEDTSPPRDGFVQTNGIGMHYLDWGEAGKPQVLFLHGGGLTAHTWDFTCLQLRHDYHCLALDLRGHGDSDGDGINLEPFTHREDIRGLVAELGLGRFVMVGMSMGGMNTIAYAGTHADDLAGAVIVDVSPYVRPDGSDEVGTFTGAFPAYESLDHAVEDAHRFNPHRPKEHLRYSLLHNLRQDGDGRFRWKYDRGNHAPRDPEKQRARMREVEAQLWPEVAKITCPALVVRGGISKVMLEEDAERLRAALPDGRRVTIPNAGHTVQGDQPKLFAAALRDFFAEIRH